MGTGIPVTVAGLTLTGAQATDYTLSQPTATATITPRALTVGGVTAADKVYDRTTAAVLSAGNVTLEGVIGGGAVTLGMRNLTGMFVSRDVGTGIPVHLTGSRV